MAEKLAATYRYVTKDKEGSPVRVVLRPGDSVKNLPKDIRDDLKQSGLIVDEKRLTEDGLRIPPGMEDREGSPRERANRALQARGLEPVVETESEGEDDGEDDGDGEGEDEPKQAQSGDEAKQAGAESKSNKKDK